MNEKQKKGLTYGRLMLIMLALILFAVGFAFFRQQSLGPITGFADVGIQAVLEANYSLTEVTASELDQRKILTRKDTGSLLFVRTNAGNYAKLSVEFSPCLLDSPNVKFRIFKGTVYDPAGEVIQNLDLKCVDLNEQFDLDSGLSTRDGAPEGTPDLMFVSRGNALHTARALPQAFIALPGQEEIAH